MDFNTLMCLALKSQMWPQPLILRTISRPFTKFYINEIEWKIPCMDHVYQFDFQGHLCFSSIEYISMYKNVRLGCTKIFHNSVKHNRVFQTPNLFLTQSFKSKQNIDSFFF